MQYWKVKTKTDLVISNGHRNIGKLKDEYKNFKTKTDFRISNGLIFDSFIGAMGHPYFSSMHNPSITTIPKVNGSISTPPIELNSRESLFYVLPTIMIEAIIP